MRSKDNKNLPRFALPKANYRRRFELGLISSLSLTVMAFFFMRDWQMPVTVREHKPIILTVENIPPQTRQLGARRPPPPRPAIPIPTESEMIPEDETIEPTTLDLSIGEIASAGNSEGIGGGGQIIPPRPLAFLVIENTTGSARCAQAALRAALASRFTPARNAQGAVKYWLIQPYRFDLKN